MRAVQYEAFRGLPRVVELPDPACPPDGVVVEVAATGLCRSDWHGWMGHDSDIVLPHVPGHELAGTVVATGTEVRSWEVGDRVTTPFVLACGACPSCGRGDAQVCERQLQPGFTRQGSFAQLVALERAEHNLVRLPDQLGFDVAAGLGCRFATAYRAVVQLGEVGPGDSVVVHGCGGVGLSAVMIAAARGADVIAVDVAGSSLALAATVGAAHLVDASVEDVPEAVRELTSGGADVSLDALGSTGTLQNSLRCLRRRARHVQVGLTGEALTAVPMGLVIGSELVVLGSHGMAAAGYPAMLAEIASGLLHPEQLLRGRITLDEAPARLAALGEPGGGAGGITVIEP